MAGAARLFTFFLLFQCTLYNVVTDLLFDSFFFLLFFLLFSPSFFPDGINSSFSVWSAL